MEIIKKVLNRNSLVVSLSIIITGFILMAKGNEFIKLTISPIILLGGYSLVIFAIMKPKRDNKE